eukprot:Unigene4273_Nuclearia_a/m.13033 Unigene4273_Nuclearia_a/g.13033  ORF Unigene4273_Nuclearia_a/g.13033 Unigene4273_Nuclearia_a/m.13033 type:complete len:179 (-) Unigene4273_Nuclearia_a:1177-1713(-)
MLRLLADRPAGLFFDATGGLVQGTLSYLITAPHPSSCKARPVSPILLAELVLSSHSQVAVLAALLQLREHGRVARDKRRVYALVLRRDPRSLALTATDARAVLQIKSRKKADGVAVWWRLPECCAVEAHHRCARALGSFVVHCARRNWRTCPCCASASQRCWRRVACEMSTKVRQLVA